MRRETEQVVRQWPSVVLTSCTMPMMKPTFHARDGLPVNNVADQ
jgi:hypothetical protein